MTVGGTVLNEPLISAQNSEHDLKNEEISQSKSGEDELGPINGVKDFSIEFFIEAKKLWYLAGPVIFTNVCQYGLMATTMLVVGHIGTIQLAAVSVENSVVAGFAYGILMGMSSALETFCGQAFGANQLDILGLHMQRSLLILNIMALAMAFLYIFATPLLKLLGQTAAISAAAGKFSLWMIPQEFAYAVMLPTTKFLQAQRRVVAVAVIAALSLGLHVFLTWFLMLKLRWGLAGAAVTLNMAWWFIAISQLLYILAGTCGEAWSGFSWKAFENLWSFLKISVASALMICSEPWNIMVLTLFVGNLANAEVSIDASSVCTNILGWASMISMGFHVAASVRVSNEVGSERPRRAKFAAMVAIIIALLVGILFVIILMVTSKQYPTIFTNSSEVKHLIEKLTPLLGTCILFTNVQFTLTGTAIGVGWQTLVSCINIVCYFALGTPSGVLMAFKFKMGIKGLWSGLLLGLALQSSAVLWMICTSNWKEEADIAKERLKGWGGKTDTEGASKGETSSTIESVRKL